MVSVASEKTTHQSRCWRNGPVCAWSALSRSKHSCLAQLAFNFQQTVVLDYAFAAADRACLDLRASHGYRKIGHETVFRFAGTVRDHEAPAGLAAKMDRRHRFTDRADLIQFDERGITGFFLDRTCDEMGIRDEVVIPDYLNLVAQARSMCAESVLIVLRQTVLDRDNRIFAYPCLI